MKSGQLKVSHITKAMPRSSLQWYGDLPGAKGNSTIGPSRMLVAYVIHTLMELESQAIAAATRALRAGAMNELHLFEQE